MRTGSSPPPPQNTVIVIVTGLGLLGLSTMFCDFVLLNYSPERKKVKHADEGFITYNISDVSQ